MEPTPQRETSPFQLAERRLGKALARAITDFKMIEDGDRIMVCVSGGKDSYTMLHLLRELGKRAPVKFELKVVNVDQGHPGYPADRLTDYMRAEAYDFHMEKEDTYSIVTSKIPEGKTFCSLCSRLRRGVLYRLATELGCNKIALGHHSEDILQTFLLNFFFAGQLSAMPPVLHAERGHIVIRPLAYCREADIQLFSDEMRFPILPCDLCGSQDNLQRKVVGRLIEQIESERPGTKAIMFAALEHVRPSHLLDRNLWKTLGLKAAVESDLVGASRLTRTEL